MRLSSAVISFSPHLADADLVALMVFLLLIDSSFFFFFLGYLRYDGFAFFAFLFPFSPNVGGNRRPAVGFNGEIVWFIPCFSFSISFSRLSIGAF